MSCVLSNVLFLLGFFFPDVTCAVFCQFLQNVVFLGVVLSEKLEEEKRATHVRFLY